MPSIDEDDKNSVDSMEAGTSRGFRPPTTLSKMTRSLLPSREAAEQIPAERAFRQRQRLSSARPWTEKLQNSRIPEPDTEGIDNVSNVSSIEDQEPSSGEPEKVEEKKPNSVRSHKSSTLVTTKSMATNGRADDEDGEESNRPSTSINQQERKEQILEPKSSQEMNPSTSKQMVKSDEASKLDYDGIEVIELGELPPPAAAESSTSTTAIAPFLRQKDGGRRHLVQGRSFDKAENERITIEEPEDDNHLNILQNVDLRKTQELGRRNSLGVPQQPSRRLTRFREQRVQRQQKQLPPKTVPVQSKLKEHRVEISKSSSNLVNNSSEIMSLGVAAFTANKVKVAGGHLPAIQIQDETTNTSITPLPAIRPLENGGLSTGITPEREEIAFRGETRVARGFGRTTLISTISKSVSRFKNRNRVLDANAIEQANFMSKFGIGVQPGAVQIEPGQFVVGGVKQPRSSNLCRYFWKEWTFDETESYFYGWIALVSIAYVYNLLVVIARTVFSDLSAGRLWILWLFLDLSADAIYICDMFVRTRTGYLEQGMLVRDHKKIRALYFRSQQFLIDLASMFPVEYFASFVLRKQFPALRLNRLLKRERIQRFMEQTETRSSMPNAFRVSVVVWYIGVIIHWNACFYFWISESIGLGTDGWVYGVQNKQSLPDGVNDTLTRRYIYSFYWSTLILTTIGEVPGPQKDLEYVFVTIDLMCGVLIFATIVGNVGSMISNMSAGRTEFQNRIDSIKQYMEVRGVGKQLESRVIKWFDYLWANKQSLTDQQVLKVLPDKLQAEIAMHVHFETLRKVRIFQDCEAGLLAELVLKLQLQVFSPGDYVCRKGDIGREMYIVKRGMLQVVAEDGMKVFATLSEGAVFGELSILNISGSKNGNRRTANVRSVGYTDLFVLNKNDLWTALREYPEARKIMINKGRELLRKDNLLDENAPEENRTVEELTDDLQSSIRILQTRMARLTAEHINTETKLRERIVYLEGKLRKYRVIDVNDHNDDADEDDQADHHHQESTADEEDKAEESQLLLRRQTTQ